MWMVTAVQRSKNLTALNNSYTEYTAEHFSSAVFYFMRLLKSY